MSIFANLLNALRVRRIEVAGEELGTTGSLAHREFLVPNMVCERCAERCETSRQRCQKSASTYDIGFTTLDTSEST